MKPTSFLDKTAELENVRYLLQQEHCKKLHIYIYISLKLNALCILKVDLFKWELYIKFRYKNSVIL